jgi:uncharacterized protein (DUF433 family)
VQEAEIYSLTKDDIQAAIAYAAELARERVVGFFLKISP